VCVFLSSLLFVSFAFYAVLPAPSHDPNWSCSITCGKEEEVGLLCVVVLFVTVVSDRVFLTLSLV